MHIVRVILLLLLAAAPLASALAQPAPEAGQPAAAEQASAREAQIARMREILGSLDFKEGGVPLNGGLATINTTDAFRYLDPADTETFLTKLWGNPPGAGSHTLGMLVPTNPHPLSPTGWAAVISYSEKGYVSDADAESTDYDQLLKDMQADVRENNAARISQGYESLELVGWARAPFYDKAGKKLYWAKRLRFGAERDETLNFVINILGRRGVLALTVVSTMDALPDIDAKAQAILDTVSFTPGNTYADYVPSMDKVAEVGIAGLIAGGVLAKTGVLKAIFLFLLAFKKAALIGGIALLSGVWIAAKRLFGRRPG